MRRPLFMRKALEPRITARRGLHPVRQRLVPRHYRKAHARKAFRDHTRANHSSRIAAAEFQCLTAQPRRYESHWQKIAGEIEQVLQVVGIADVAERVIDYPLLVGDGQLMWPADADIEVA